MASRWALLFALFSLLPLLPKLSPSSLSNQSSICNITSSLQAASCSDLPHSWTGTLACHASNPLLSSLPAACLFSPALCRLSSLSLLLLSSASSLAAFLSMGMCSNILHSTHLFLSQHASELSPPSQKQNGRLSSHYKHSGGSSHSLKHLEGSLPHSLSNLSALAHSLASLNIYLCCLSCTAASYHSALPACIRHSSSPLPSTSPPLSHLTSLCLSSLHSLSASLLSRL